MPAASTIELINALTLYRETHAGATRLAGRVWPLVESLKASRMWLPREAALRYLANAIYFNSGYDACMNYDSAEEFAEVLRDDLDAGWPDREMLDGVEHHVLRPFFGDVPYLHEAGMSSLGACRLSEISELKAAPRPKGLEVAVTGVADEELEALIALHKTAALTIVNTVRFLATALGYPMSALKRISDSGRELAVVFDSEVSERLAALTEAAVIPGIPKPDAYFSSNWDKDCRISDLPADGPLALYLRSC
jgi:hypothetical protein